MFYQLTFVQPQATGWPMSTRGDLFAGLTVALVTPFKNGEIDFDDLGRLVDWHVEQGTDTLAPVGTTGESPTLSHEEHDQVVAWCIEEIEGNRYVSPIISDESDETTDKDVFVAQPDGGLINRRGSRYKDIDDAKHALLMYAQADWERHHRGEGGDR